MKGVIVVGLALMVLLGMAFLLQPDTKTEVSSEPTNTTAGDREVTPVPEFSDGWVVLPILGAMLLLMRRRVTAS